MKKDFKAYVVIWLIGLAIFNVIAFLIPGDDKFTLDFFVGYGFITLAYVLQLGVGYFAFKEKNINKVFLNLPTVTISFTTLVCTAIVAVITMAVEPVPAWLGAILCFVCFGIGAISILLANQTAGIVGGIDDKVKSQTFFIKALTIDVDTLSSQAPSSEIRAEVLKVYEAVRYSDPMSNEALTASESQITVKFNQLSDAVVAGDSDGVKVLANEMLILIKDRNNKCKLLK